MVIDVDTFLTTVYATVDDFCQAHPSPIRPGPKPVMSDSEVLTIQLLKAWHGTSQRGALAWIAQSYHAWFPTLLTPGAFNCRARALTPTMAQLLFTLARKMEVWHDTFEIIDGLAIPLAEPQRGQKRKCFTEDEAGIGRGGVGKDWYYGVALVGCVSDSGILTGFVTAPAENNEHWLAHDLLSWRADPTAIPVAVELEANAKRHHRQITGPTGHHLSPTTAGEMVTGVYLADKGFRGAIWRETWETQCGATVITSAGPHRRDRRLFHRARRRIESVFSVLIGVLHIRHPQSRTEEGVITHLVATCTALNLGIYLNRSFNRPDLALGTLFRG